MTVYVHKLRFIELTLTPWVRRKVVETHSCVSANRQTFASSILFGNLNVSSTNSTLCAQPCYCQTVETHSCVSDSCQVFATGDFIRQSCLLRRKNASLHFDNNRLYEYPQFPQQEIRSIFMVSFRLQSILASMAKYYWILHYLSLLLSRLKHSFICKGVIGQNADIHYRLCAQDEIRRTHVNLTCRDARMRLYTLQWQFTCTSWDSSNLR